MWEAEREEFALEALATSDSWDAGAGRVFTFPPLSAHRHQWGPLPAEQVLGGGGWEQRALHPPLWLGSLVGTRMWDRAARKPDPN